MGAGLLRACDQQLASDPGFDRFPQLAQAAFEKVVAGFDEDQLLWLGKRGDHLFELGLGGELIARATDEELGLGAGAEEIKVVAAVIDRGDRCAQADESVNAGVGTSGAQSYGSSEGKAGKDNGLTVLLLEPVQRNAHIGEFTFTVGMFALAQPSAAEIKAQHRKSETVQRLHGVEYNFVVKRAAVDRMGMADEGGVGGVFGAKVQEGFEAASGTVKKKRLDRGIRG